MKTSYLPLNHRESMEYDLYDTIRKMEYILKNAKLSDLELVRVKSTVDRIQKKYMRRIKDLTGRERFIEDT
jgi:hypothetical protein